MDTTNDSSTQAKGIEQIAPDVILDHGSQRVAYLLSFLALAFAAFATWWFGLHRDDPFALFRQRQSSRERHKRLYGRPIKIGILHSRKGPMAAIEGNVLRATLLAVNELNREGGVLGRKVIPLLAAGASTPAQLAAQAEDLIQRQGVVALFGGWRSDGRKALLPVLRRHDHVLLYPASYEGLEESPHIIYLGATASQRIKVLVDWALHTKGARRLFFVGSDSLYARGTQAILRDYLTDKKASLVDTHYIPAGSLQVEAVAQALMKRRPDVIINAMRGVSNLAFFATLRQLGLTSKRIPTISLTLAEPELKVMDIGQIVGDYAVWSYFQPLQTAANRTFLRRLQRTYGINSQVSASMQAAYTGVKLWAQAVHRARSTDPKGVRDVIHQRPIDAPEGSLQIDASSHHIARHIHIGQIQESGKFRIVHSTPKALPPSPFPSTRDRASWHRWRKQQRQWRKRQRHQRRALRVPPPTSRPSRPASRPSQRAAVRHSVPLSPGPQPPSRRR